MPGPFMLINHWLAINDLFVTFSTKSIENPQFSNLIYQSVYHIYQTQINTCKPQGLLALTYQLNKQQKELTYS